MNWKSIVRTPPPENILVWVTDWRTFSLAKRILVARGKKKEYGWNYRSMMVPGATHWCTREEFEGAVSPDG